MCKKTPIIKADISVLYFEKNSILSVTNTPIGLIKANTPKKITMVLFVNLECIKNVVSTMAIGILWTTIAHNKLASSL